MPIIQISTVLCSHSFCKIKFLKLRRKGHPIIKNSYEYLQILKCHNINKYLWILKPKFMNIHSLLHSFANNAKKHTAFENLGICHSGCSSVEGTAVRLRRSCELRVSLKLPGGSVCTQSNFNSIITNRLQHFNLSQYISSIIFFTMAAEFKFTVQFKFSL